MPAGCASGRSPRTCRAREARGVPHTALDVIKRPSGAQNSENLFPAASCLAPFRGPSTALLDKAWALRRRRPVPQSPPRCSADTELFRAHTPALCEEPIPSRGELVERWADGIACRSRARRDPVLFPRAVGATTSSLAYFMTGEPGRSKSSTLPDLSLHHNATPWPTLRASPTEAPSLAPGVLADFLGASRRRLPSART